MIPETVGLTEFEITLHCLRMDYAEKTNPFLKEELYYYAQFLSPLVKIYSLFKQ